MIKLYAFIAKRPDLSTEAFIHHYENHHVPLILSIAPPPLVYKRHYVTRHGPLDPGTPAADFDVVTEVAWADNTAYTAWAGEIAKHAELVAEDEARFFQRNNVRSMMVEEDSGVIRAVVGLDRS